MKATATHMLSVAAKQFAEKGYSGASMRNIANAVGTTQAAIYHHFPNKNALYLAVLARHFDAKSSGMADDLAQVSDPEERLKILVHRLLELVEEDEQFRQLYFRELLETDEERLRVLADNVFGELAVTLTSLLEELAPRMDSHLMLLSLGGLVCHHLEARKLSPFLPGGKRKHQQLDVLAEHITELLLHGVQRS